jgi:hypothetical protein
MHILPAVHDKSNEICDLKLFGVFILIFLNFKRLFIAKIGKLSFLIQFQKREIVTILFCYIKTGICEINLIGTLRSQQKYVEFDGLLQLSWEA